MTQVLTFVAEEKKISGTGSARAERREGRIPAIIYGGKDKEIMISVKANEFNKEFFKGNMQARLVKLQLGKKEIMALPKAVQTHPVTDMPLHIDFRQIDEGSKVKVKVHIKLINDDKCPGVKKGGVLNLVQRDLEVACDPNSIPSHIEIDVSTLEMGHSIHMRDVQLPPKVEAVAKPDLTIITIAGRAAEETAEEAPTTEAPAK
jgi:large subunit ribosomal protein L25